MSDDDWRAVIDTNLSSVFYTCRAVTRPMMKKRAGSIVNISSIVGLHGNWGQTNYGASKAGIVGFTKSLARELGSRGVRANVIAPGYVKSRLTDVLPEEATQAMLDEHAARPARRAGGRRAGGTVPVPPTRPRSSRARCCSSTADWGCDGASENGNGRRRVVVTGIGMVSSLGNDVESSWRALVAGESGVGADHVVRHERLPGDFACELKDFDPTVWIDRKASRRMDRFVQLVLAAARQAEQDSGVDVAADPSGSGASIATGIGGLQLVPGLLRHARDRGPDRVSPFAIPTIIPNMGAGWVSIELGTKGPLTGQTTACAASNMAIGDALDAIRHGPRAT